MSESERDLDAVASAYYDRDWARKERIKAIDKEIDVRKIANRLGIAAIVSGLASICFSQFNDSEIWTNAAYGATFIFSGWTLIYERASDRARRVYYFATQKMIDSSEIFRGRARDFMKSLDVKDDESIHDHSLLKGVENGYLDKNEVTEILAKRRQSRVDESCENDRESGKESSYDFMPPEDRPNWRGTD